ncbi:MAG: hypothetical protein DI570_21400 [Phenylobacterium zucineum]|nr:MAG: hypothetical protein DI570_21400 [Phenylobacterium zucineum]
MKMKTFALSCIATATIAVGSASAATYSVYDQFAISGNAITAANFAFGYAASNYAGSDTITSFSTFQAACGGDVLASCATVNGGLPGIFKPVGDYDVAGTAFFEAGELNLHPGGNSEVVVVQFIAPIAGFYNFAGAFSYNDILPTGVDVAAYLGGASQIANAIGDFDFNATLTAGQKVNFAVGAAGNWTFDSTGFELVITGPDRTGAVPEPSAWAMMILGFGAAGTLLRRRRSLLA